MLEHLNVSGPHQHVHTLHKLIFCTCSFAWMHEEDLPVHIYHKHTYITNFLAISPCLDLSNTLPLSCSMHLSSSLCCVWFVKADDESVYEWRELISPEWSLPLSLSTSLSFTFSTVSVHPIKEDLSLPLLPPPALFVPAGCFCWPDVPV